MTVKTLAKRVLGYAVHRVLPVPAAPAAVLTYHSIGDGARGSQSANRFSEQMRWLHDHRESFVVSAGDILSAASSHGATVLITFDDGYLDNWELAKPILDHYGFKAYFFVTTGFIDGDLSIIRKFKNYRGLRPMTWDHLGLLSEQGHVVGLHGDKHLNFGAVSQQQAFDDLKQCGEKLFARTGLRASTFAYPFGLLEHQRDDMDCFFSDLGIRLAFTSMHSRADLSKIRAEGSYRYCIPRLRVDPLDSLNVFAEKLYGYWDFVSNVQRVRYVMAPWQRGTVSRLPRTK